jgi:hypothetical protein
MAVTLEAEAVSQQKTPRVVGLKGAIPKKCHFSEFKPDKLTI